MSSTPQQPELHRSGKGAPDPKSAKGHVDSPAAEEGTPGQCRPITSPATTPSTSRTSRKARRRNSGDVSSGGAGGAGPPPARPRSA